MIKDNSGYRASPRRIETLVGNQSDASNASNSPKISKGSNNTPQVRGGCKYKQKMYLRISHYHDYTNMTHALVN